MYQCCDAVLQCVALGDYSILQPTVPSPKYFCVWALSLMLGEAGKAEASLQGASSAAGTEKRMVGIQEKMAAVGAASTDT